MGKTRREWLKDTLRAGTAFAAAPLSVMPARRAPERNLALNRAAYASSSSDFINTGHMATDGQIMTRWSSKDADPQWIYVDLGDTCTVGRVVLRWGENFAKAYKIQVSTERGASPATGLVETWTDVYETHNGKGAAEKIPLASVKARHVRLLCNERAIAGGYSLCGFEVYGTGGPTVPLTYVPLPGEEGTLELTGGWKLVNQSFVSDEAAKISTCGYDDSKWLVATVPGTVLTTHLNLGAIPDPFYSDHQFQVSDWFAHCQWWYRNEVAVPASYKGKRVWLSLDGINHKADIYVNGSLAGKMAGAFIRGRFDITEKVAVGKKNCVAVLIYPVPKPDKVLVRTLKDYVGPREFPRNEPTFFESAGWDWLPTIRDRNIGIWNDVTLSTSGDVTIIDPFVITDLPLLPDLSRADLTLKVEMKNHSDQQRRGVLRGQLGDIRFTHPVTLEAGESKTLSLDKSACPELSLRGPKLWWPNGYGEQNLYDFSLRVELDGSGVSDVKNAKIGIRKYTYNQESLTAWDVKTLKVVHGGAFVLNKNPLTISCNGQRIMVKGANWGMDEGMLRCDRDGYETRLRMEKDMNFTMIRSCLGNLGKEEFFETCDRYGLMIWEEFGMHDSLMPDDIGMWMANARDRLMTRRNHACVALWCTVNEGFSDEPIRSEMPKLVEALDGTRLFLQGSTQYPPTDGDGPYVTHPPLFYFNELAHGWRTELGSPTVLPVESMRRMMPHNQLWPIGQMWATHDWWIGDGTRRAYCMHNEKAVTAYGAPTGIEDFCRKGQMVNMEVFKAIYEAWNDKLWDNCTGVMIWASNPTWPSLTWNTYDYYLEPTGAYFAIKKACEPIHVQWSIASNDVKVVNCTLKDLNGLSAEAHVYNLDGSVFLKKSIHLDVANNCVRRCFNLFEIDDVQSASLSDVHFIKLELKDRDEHLLSDNFYWRGKSLWKYQDLSSMEKVGVTGTVNSTQDGDACRITANVRNENKGVALMTRLKLVDVGSGLLVAPVMYSDNYFSLPPGGSKIITIHFRAKGVSGRETALAVEGWNVTPAELARVRIVHGA